MSTGYFGIPGRLGGKVHWVIGGKPECGLRIHPRAEFQFCSSDIQLSYLECAGCIKKARKEMQRRHDERMKVMKNRLNYRRVSW